MKTRKRALIAAAGLVFATVGCGGAPTSGHTEPSTAEEEGTDDPYQDVLAELDGLTGQERRERLVELAEQEDATLQAYGANTDLSDQAAKFTEEYGIQVEVYRANANQVLQRVLREAEAGRLRADLIDNNGYEMTVIARSDLTVDYAGPVLDQLREETDRDGWTVNRFTLISTVWNTEVMPGEPPAEFSDLADSRLAGEILLEPRAFDWYMALSTWFQDNGMSEEQVDDLFREVAGNSTLLESHTNHIQFLAAGEYAVSVATYNHLADDVITEGGPLDRLPAVEPVVARPNGIGLTRVTDYPASTLLFFEWMLTDAQDMFVEDHRVPAMDGLGDELLEGIDELVTIDFDRLVEDEKSWQDRYDELVRASS